MERQRLIAILAGSALVAAGVIPGFIHRGACDPFADELGWQSGVPTSENPYGLLVCCFMGGYSPADEFGPIMYRCGLIMLGMVVAMKLSPTNRVALATVTSFVGTFVGGVIGISASGLSLHFLPRDLGLYGSLLNALAIGLLVAWLERQMAPNNTLQRTRGGGLR